MGDKPNRNHGISSDAEKIGKRPSDLKHCQEVSYTELDRKHFEKKYDIG